MMNNDKRNQTKTKIINYLLNHPATSKTDLALELGMSMPTILSNVNDLSAKDILCEIGEYESTGGRKAKKIGINKYYARAVGIIITANHVELIMVNLGYEVEQRKRIRLAFSAELSYCTALAEELKSFLAECNQERLLGVGFSIPGIIDQEQHMLLKSHVLKVENYSLRLLEQLLELPCYFENDANAAILSENLLLHQNALYLSLSHTLGGAFCIDGQLYRGQNQKAGEFGHMILVPGGRKCYCGKSGCADAYCAASVLTNNGQITLDSFMEQVKKGDKPACDRWETYLDHLAILISNLRMAYDIDIILGGDVGGVLKDYMMPLCSRVMAYNGFDYDTSYLKQCSYQREASGIGAAKHFFMNL